MVFNLYYVIQSFQFKEKPSNSQLKIKYAEWKEKVVESFKITVKQKNGILSILVAGLLTELSQISVIFQFFFNSP